LPFDWYCFPHHSHQIWTTCGINCITETGCGAPTKPFSGIKFQYITPMKNSFSLSLFTRQET